MLIDKRGIYYSGKDMFSSAIYEKWQQLTALKYVFILFFPVSSHSYTHCSVKVVIEVKGEK